MIAVTGAAGFIGSQVVSTLLSAGERVVALARGPILGVDHGPAVVVREIGDLGSANISPGSLAGCRTVIHAAARAHVLQEQEADPLNTFLRINTDGTMRLAEAAFVAGVRRFVFVSSIGVLGNRSCGAPLAASDALAPVEDYAVSKARAEVALEEFARRTGMEVVIVRPPLVHGLGAKGNFMRLLAAVYRRHPLPLGAIANRRSFLGVANLAEGLTKIAAASWPEEEEKRQNLMGSNVRVLICHMADDGTISTRQLIETLADGMGIPARLLSVPRWIVVGGATILGKGAMARRLFDDLEVDDSGFRRLFSFRPRNGLEQGLRIMASDYARRQRLNS